MPTPGNKEEQTIKNNKNIKLYKTISNYKNKNNIKYREKPLKNKQHQKIIIRKTEKDMKLIFVDQVPLWMNLPEQKPEQQERGRKRQKQAEKETEKKPEEEPETQEEESGTQPWPETQPEHRGEAVLAVLQDLEDVFKWNLETESA